MSAYYRGLEDVQESLLHQASTITNAHEAPWLVGFQIGGLAPPMQNIELVITQVLYAEVRGG